MGRAALAVALAGLLILAVASAASARRGPPHRGHRPRPPAPAPTPAPDPTPPPTTTTTPTTTTPTTTTTTPAPSPQRQAVIFYYPWYSTPSLDGAWAHWNQGGHTPPNDLASRWYPARGPYSSSDSAVVHAQMAEIAQTGISQVASSWWGRGSTEDRRLPLVIDAAHAAGLGVAIQLEPYSGRSAGSVASDLRYLAGLGITDVYVYKPTLISASSWAAVTRPSGMRLFAQTWDTAFAQSAKFQGVYTYSFEPGNTQQFVTLCDAARARGLLCAPSVGPGYDATKATGDSEVVDRANGATYDFAWKAALAGNPDLVTVTSYNEWDEGTQIEPAAARAGWPSYDGAWGATGQAAQNAYLDATARWVAQLKALG